MEEIRKFAWLPGMPQPKRMTEHELFEFESREKVVGRPQGVRFVLAGIDLTEWTQALEVSSMRKEIDVTTMSDATQVMMEIGVCSLIRVSLIATKEMAALRSIGTMVPAELEYPDAGWKWHGQARVVKWRTHAAAAELLTHEIELLVDGNV